MSKELQELIEKYRQKNELWQDLVEKEKAVREELVEKNDGDEPEDLRSLLDEAVEKSGLRKAQQEALAELKKAEQKLFAFNVDHCTDPDLKQELEHLAQDYAARITWLKQFLEPLDVLKEKSQQAQKEKKA
ncbi:MAG: hypothetical protein Q4E09_00720 [Eubacteriales bacterium]|nr:hypothetical protein [Eubacteriales bacterium]